MNSQVPTPVRPDVTCYPGQHQWADGDDVCACGKTEVGPGNDPVTTEAAKIDKAMTLVGQVVTDGKIMGVLDLVEGETWAVTLSDGEAMIHSHTAIPIPEYREPVGGLSVQALMQGYDRTYVDTLTLAAPLSTLRKGVTLAKPTD